MRTRSFDLPRRKLWQSLYTGDGDVIVLTRSWVHDTSGTLVTKMVDSKSVNQSIDKIVRLIRHYEIKEATTMFELALRKAKIDQVDDELAIRDACRKCLGLLKLLSCNL